MTLSEQLKTMRKKAGLSQERLAEKIGVSRQAITKWESGFGIPDIENIIALSNLFHVSIDEFLGTVKPEKINDDYIYESITEYDIDQMKHYDISLGGGQNLYIIGYEGEKIRVRLVSNTYENLQKDFKVKIDDISNRIDVDVKRSCEVTETMAKEAVSFYIQLPNTYIGKVELEMNAENVKVSSLECDDLELNLKTTNLKIGDVHGNIEIDCNQDMNIAIDSLYGELSINQVKATSKICVPKDLEFSIRTRGIGNSIHYEQDKTTAKKFEAKDTDNLIELNGIKSELVICTTSEV